MIAMETDRLTIRNFGPDDWQDLQEVAGDYQASEWAKYEDPWPTSTEEVKGMAEWFAQGDDYLAVCLQAAGKLIGLIAIGGTQSWLRLPSGLSRPRIRNGRLPGGYGLCVWSVGGRRDTYRHPSGQ